MKWNAALITCLVLVFLRILNFGQIEFASDALVTPPLKEGEIYNLTYRCPVNSSF